MTAFLLLVTWLAYGQPPDHYQVPFSSNEACEAARLGEGVGLLEKEVGMHPA